MTWVWERREDRAQRDGMEPLPVLSLPQAAVVALSVLSEVSGRAGPQAPLPW